MPVHVECERCGHAHRIPDRRFDPETGRTTCPECGARSYVVHRTNVRWHPDG